MKKICLFSKEKCSGSSDLKRLMYTTSRATHYNDLQDLLIYFLSLFLWTISNPISAFTYQMS